jgi:hypothetical protein
MTDYYDPNLFIDDADDDALEMVCRYGEANMAEYAALGT